MSHVIELHHHRDRCRIVCRRCGELTDGATPEMAGRIIARHRRERITEPARVWWRS